jgi:hypothetical protein
VAKPPTRKRETSHSLPSRVKARKFSAAASRLATENRSRSKSKDLLSPFRERVFREGPNLGYRLASDPLVLRAAERYARLLDREPSETEAQRFLEKNPFLIAAGIMGGGFALERVAVFPKVKFGNELISDLALVTADSDGARWTFVELESPTSRMFTRSGNPSHALTHGLRQVDDWAAFLQDQMVYAKTQLAKLHKSAQIHGPLENWRAPTFMVVIGRENGLSSNTRRRKAQMNDLDPRRQIVTYDRFNPLRRFGWKGQFDDEEERRAWPSDENEGEYRLSVDYLKALRKHRGSQSAPRSSAGRR